MKTFRVKLTRLVEQECHIYVQAPDADTAMAAALADANEIEPIWDRSDTEAENVTAESAFDCAGTFAPTGFALGGRSEK